jgi:hypothetical protein
MVIPVWRRPWLFVFLFFSVAIIPFFPDLKIKIAATKLQIKDGACQVLVCLVVN